MHINRLAHRWFGVFLLCLVYGHAQAQLRAGEEDSFNLARNLFRDARDYATASELFAEFIRNHPNSRFLPEARLMLARSHKHSGRYAQAILAYESFYQNHPEHLEIAAARRERAACLGSSGQYLKAAHAYEDVHRRFSASDFAPKALLKAAQYYTQADSLKQASLVYENLINRYGRVAAAHTARYSLAKLRFASGQVEAAQQLLVEIADATPAAVEAPNALLLSGRIYLFIGNRDRASSRFNRLQNNHPASAHADSSYLEMADYLFEQRQFVQAGDAFLVAVENISEPMLRYTAHLGMADAKRLSQRNEAAARHYRTLLGDLSPGHPYVPKAQLGLSITLGQSGEFVTAVGLLQDLIQKTPDSNAGHSALRELGRLYSERGDFILAISWYRRYLEEAAEAPDRDQVHYTLANAYAATGDYQSAATTYRELTDLGGAWAGEAQFGLAHAYEAAGQHQAALREYLVVLEQYPGSRHIATARHRIEYLRDFSVTDREVLSQALQQALIDELSGSSRQSVQWSTAQTLLKLQDYDNAVRLLEHFIAVNPSSTHRSEAQWLLSQSLLRLTRKKELESVHGAADSLRQLALQEFRILARDSTGGEWAQRAALHLLELEAGTEPDSLKLVQYVSGLRNYLDQDRSRSLVEATLLHLGEAYQQLALYDSLYATEAIGVFEHFINEYPESRNVARALYNQGEIQGNRGQNTIAEELFLNVIQEHVDRSIAPLALYKLGQLYYSQSRYTEARSRLEELRWAYPTFEQRQAAHELLASTYIQVEEYNNAVALYELLVDNQPDSEKELQLRSRLARAYSRNGQLQAALNCYRILINRTYKGDVFTDHGMIDSVFFAKGQILEEMGKPQEAVSQYLRVQRDGTMNGIVHAAIGRATVLLVELGQFAEAQELVKPYLDVIDDPVVYGQAVLALFRQGKLDEAREGARSFGRRFDNVSDWTQQFGLEEGRQLLKEGHFERAQDLFQQVARADDEWADAGAYYAALTLWNQNASNPSRESSAKALEAQANFIRTYPDSPYAPSVHMRIGDYHHSLRNYLQAAGAYRHVHDKTEDTSLAGEALWRLVVSYQAAHEYDEAYQAVQRLINHFPDHPRRQDAEVEIGIILKDMGRFSQAIVKLENALQWVQGDRASEARYYIGEAYQNMGNYRRAIEAYYRVSFYGAEGHSQWITSADYRRAQCHEALGESRTAIAVYERILQREGSDSPQGRLAYERMSVLRED